MAQVLEYLVRQQALPLALTPAQPPAPALGSILPSPVVTPDVSEQDVAMSKKEQDVISITASSDGDHFPQYAAAGDRLPRASPGLKPSRPCSDKKALLDAPISPGHRFGPAVEEILQCSQREREASRQVAAMLPSRAPVQERMRCWCPPVTQTVTRTVPIPTAPSDFRGS
ncbi:UNVERIFIED_CONTAM: hypothetical protein FKN15_045468 [Acipenser sinensis]